MPPRRSPNPRTVSSPTVSSSRSIGKAPGSTSSCASAPARKTVASPSLTPAPTPTPPNRPNTWCVRTSSSPRSITSATAGSISGTTCRSKAPAGKTSLKAPARPGACFTESNPIGQKIRPTTARSPSARPWPWTPLGNSPRMEAPGRCCVAKTLTSSSCPPSRPGISIPPPPPSACWKASSPAPCSPLGKTAPQFPRIVSPLSPPVSPPFPPPHCPRRSDSKPRPAPPRCRNPTSASIPASSAAGGTSRL